MKEILERIESIDKYKDTIIADVIGVGTIGVSNSQAQNLREYAVKTRSIDEILLYINYQCARDADFKQTGEKLVQKIIKHKEKKIHVIRFMLGTYARQVFIDNKGRQKK